MALIRISESDDWIVDYDIDRDKYRVSYFEDNHFKDECWFDGCKEVRKDIKSNISCTEILWDGETIDGEFTRGQLFRLRDHYYICHNTPFELGECVEIGVVPPQVSIWREVKLDTLKRTPWVYMDEDE